MATAIRDIANYGIHVSREVAPECRPEDGLSITEFTRVAPQDSCPQSVHAKEQKLTKRIGSGALLCMRLAFQRTARTQSICKSKL